MPFEIPSLIVEIDAEYAVGSEVGQVAKSPPETTITLTGLRELRKQYFGHWRTSMPNQVDVVSLRLAESPSLPRLTSMIWMLKRGTRTSSYCRQSLPRYLELLLRATGKHITTCRHHFELRRTVSGLKSTREQATAKEEVCHISWPYLNHASA